jgi:peptidylprolyl isomerase
MNPAKIGDTATVHYKGTLKDGSVFDTSENQEPLNFTLGKNEMIPGFENAIIGLTKGESKTFTLTPDEAYGEQDDDMILNMPRSEFPPEIDPEVGMVLKVTNEDDEDTHLMVTEMTDEMITLDGNHPLAGEDLTFEINVVEIVE